MQTGLFCWDVSASTCPSLSVRHQFSFPAEFENDIKPNSPVGWTWRPIFLIVEQRLSIILAFFGPNRALSKLKIWHYKWIHLKWELSFTCSAIESKFFPGGYKIHSLEWEFYFQSVNNIVIYVINNHNTPDSKWTDVPRGIWSTSNWSISFSRNINRSVSRTLIKAQQENNKLQ